MREIKAIEERIENVKERIASARETGEDTDYLEINLHELEDDLRFAWADQEAELNGWR